MNDPAAGDPMQMLEPVHAGESEAPKEIWAPRLVLFLRIMAVAALAKGLYHWAIVCGIDATSPAGFEAYPTPYQSATVFFAVIDLVAAVGLWLAAPWGAVVWLTSVISMAAVEMTEVSHTTAPHGAANLWRAALGCWRRALVARRLSVARSPGGARTAAMIKRAFQIL